MWQCPVCEQDIEHLRGEFLPSRHVAYRCHFCHLDLVFDEDYGRFKLAPFRDSVGPAESADRPRRKTRPRARR